MPIPKRRTYATNLMKVRTSLGCRWSLRDLSRDASVIGDSVWGLESAKEAREG
jgi:hypothetical protein